MAGQQVFQDFVVYTGEKLHDIALQHIGVAPGEVGAAVQGRVGALTFSAGVRIMDETRFPDRFDEVAEGMVGDPVAERGRRDAAACHRRP